jgi:hypothetical protein
MSDKKELQNNNQIVQYTNFKTSFGCQAEAAGGKYLAIFKPASVFGKLAPFFVFVQLILGLRHLRYTLRFATNTSFEAMIHMVLRRLCEAVEINHAILEILDYFFYISIIILAITLILELLRETASIIFSSFSKNESLKIDSKTDEK